MRQGLPPSEQKLRNEMWAKGLLWCSECDQYLPAKDFYKLRNDKYSNYGHRFYCKTCESSRKRNKKLIKERSKDRNYQLKSEFVKLAGGCCQRCGFDESIAAMDFHHVYSSTKNENPGSAIYSGDKVRAWKELDKCCMLCANCHNAYNAGEWRAEFIKRDELGWAVGKSLPLNDMRYECKPEEYIQARLPDAFRSIKPIQPVLF